MRPLIRAFAAPYSRQRTTDARDSHSIPPAQVQEDGRMFPSSHSCRRVSQSEEPT